MNLGLTQERREIMAKIILHSKTTEKISRTCCYEWSEHTFKRGPDGKLITKSRLLDKQKAQRIIKKYGLVESFSTKDGEVYDTPEGDFKKLFPNGIQNKDDAAAIEKVDKL